jgi:hypothetical protein
MNGGSQDEEENEHTPLNQPQHSSEIDLDDTERAGNNSNSDENKLRSKKHSRKETILTTLTILASIVALLFAARFLVVSVSSRTFQKDESTKEDGEDHDGKNKSSFPKQQFDHLGRFVLDDYDAKPTFSDFLPAVAGIYGKPLWTFYVNRGQGIASFGIESKNYPLLEFNSANLAYQNTALLGFRTFIQSSRGSSQTRVTEPFSPLYTRLEGMPKTEGMPKRKMIIGRNEVQIQETDFANRNETNVTYFTLPEEDFGALVRRTTITNLDLQEPLKLSLLDGLAKMEPAGGKLYEVLKGIPRTLEGWMGVYQPYNDTISMPYYRLSTEPTDSASVTIQVAGHYCLSFIEGDQSTLLPIIYDTSKVFGEDTMLLRPIELQRRSIEEIVKDKQYGFAKTSSAFAAGMLIFFGTRAAASCFS